MHSRGKNGNRHFVFMCDQFVHIFVTLPFKKGINFSFNDATRDLDEAYGMRLC